MVTANHGKLFESAIKQMDEKYALLHLETDTDRDPYVAPAYFVHPQSPQKIYWDLFIGVIILYSVVFLPYRIMFGQEASTFELVIDYGGTSLT